MKRAPSFHELARLELIAATAHYEAARSGLGRRFTNEVRRVFELAYSRPDAGRVLAEGEIRAWRLRGFPYSLIYRSRSDQFVVLAVAHDKREPLYWAHRD